MEGRKVCMEGRKVCMKGRKVDLRKVDDVLGWDIGTMTCAQLARCSVCSRSIRVEILLYALMNDWIAVFPNCRSGRGRSPCR